MANLAQTLRQVGYVTPQGQVTGPNAPLAQQLKNYVTNVIPTARQNLAQQRADIDAALTMGQGGVQIGDREAFERQMAQVPNLMGLTAYHGTPHTIKGKFDINKVGTGEGAQAYGHGMYFAENPAVAKEYQRKLSGWDTSTKLALGHHGGIDNAIAETEKRVNSYKTGNWAEHEKERANRLLQLNQKKLEELQAMKAGMPEPTGNLYKVDIPDADIPMMLDWGKPLAQQTPEVQAAIQKLGDRFRPLDDMEAKNVTGERLYRRIENSFGKYYGNQANPDASALLNSVGIKGIRYLDEGSRRQPYSVAISTKKGPYAETEFLTKEQAEQYIKEKQAEGFKTELKETGTSNFVVFEPSNVKILEQNSKPMTRKEILEQELKKVVE
jgi:hypothetical protein